MSVPQLDAGTEGTPGADDLKRIAGIGPVIERHLHEAGVRTFTQLAALTPDQIADLVAHLPLLSAERIVRQDWVGRARALANEAAAQAAGPGDRPAPGRRYATFTVELLLDPHRRVTSTRAVHVQDGATETWDGWSVERLVTFFGAYVYGLYAEEAEEHSAMKAVSADHMAAPGSTEPARPQPAPEASAAGAPGGPAELWLELGELLVETVREDEQRAPLAEVGLQARLPFTLAGPAAGQLVAEGPPYSVVILASDTADGMIAVVGTLNGRLRPGQQRYRPVIALEPPHEGRFQLLGTVLIAPAGLVQSVLGPALHVVA